VAIASPNQIHDLDVNSPNTSTSYFRTSKIELITSNSAYLNEVFDSIVNELQRVAREVEASDNLEPDAMIEITANNITANMGVSHTHYRLPLTARPCGTNTITSNIHSVGSQDTSLHGWLNTTVPLGYHFKYNIATDTALNALWPIDPDKLNYAHIESDGITENNVIINADGIFWKNNTLGNAPWPEDYVGLNNTGTPLTLVFDFIK
jgi:hypothetical protein